MMRTALLVVGFVVACAVAQRRPPNYSQDEMPDTSFNCRDKVVGGYYADQETDCQMFHVCVKVPGLGLQDYRFLCPNDTTFDQENQICANWYDIDCEASTLFYSDNFDLYRINKGPSSSKGTPIPLGPSTQRPPAALPKKRVVLDQEDDEEEFYLQRAETGDRRLQKDLLRGSSSGNFFNKNRGKDDDDEDDYKPAVVAKKPIEPLRNAPRRGPVVNVAADTNNNYNNNNNNDNNTPKKKVAVRKLRKRPQNDANIDANAQQSYESNPTTYPPSTTTDRYVNRQNNRQSSRTQNNQQDFQKTQNYEPQKSQVSSTTFQASSPSTVAPTFNEKTTRAQYQPRYNTISRNNNAAVSTTTTSTTAEPISTEAIQAQINNFQTRNSRPRFNAQRTNFAAQTSTQFVEASTTTTTTTAAPTTRNYYTQPSTKINYNNRGFENQKSSNAVSSTTINYQNAANNNQNSGSFNKAVGDFSRTTLNAYSTTFAPVTYNGNYKPLKTVKNTNNFNVKPTEKPAVPEYQDYNGNFDSYGNQRSQEASSDEYVENANNGEEEFLKTAPSNNIRPSNFNNFRKTYTDVTNVEQKATTNYNYDAKNTNDFTKTTQKNYNNNNSFRSTTQRQPSTKINYNNRGFDNQNTNNAVSSTTINYQNNNNQNSGNFNKAVGDFSRTTVNSYSSTTAPPKRPSTQFYQPSTQYYQPSSTAQPQIVTNRVSNNPPSTTAAAFKQTTASKKATEAKASGKVKDYDYAYYDDSEYEGADPISDHHFGVAGESQRISK